MLCKSLTYTDDTVMINYAGGVAGNMQFVQRENAVQNITMRGVDFRKSFTMTKPDSSYIVCNAPYIDKYAVYRVVQDVTNGRIYFVGVSKIYYFTVTSSSYTFVEIFQGERNTVDAAYYLNDNGALIVSGGIYLNTRLPCYKSWKYEVANGFLQESLIQDANTKLSQLRDANTKDSTVTADDFCVLGDSVNDKVGGQLNVLNFRKFGDKKDSGSLYYSGESGFMHDGVLQNRVPLYSVLQGTDYNL